MPQRCRIPVFALLAAMAVWSAHAAVRAADAPPPDAPQDMDAPPPDTDAPPPDTDAPPPDVAPPPPQPPVRPTPGVRTIPRGPATTKVPAASPMTSGKVAFNLAGDVDIRLFVDYVAARTGKTFIYDETLTGSISLRSPGEIPVEALMTMLQSVLEYKGYALTPGPNGVLKVVSSSAAVSKTPPLFGPGETGRLPDEDVIVTQLIALKHVAAADLISTVQSVLTGAGVTGRAPAVPAGRGVPARGSVSAGGIVAVPDQQLLVVTDYAPNVRRIVRLVESLDLPGPEARLAMVPLKHIRAEEYASRIQGVLESRTKLTGGAKREPAHIDYDDRLNALLVTGLPADIEAVRSLAADLDVVVPEEKRPYRIIPLKNSNAEDMVQTLQQVMSAREGAAGAGGGSYGPTMTGGTTTSGPPPAAGVRTASPTPRTTSPARAATTAGMRAVAGTQVSAVANRHTNSIILIGPADEQEVLAAIIEHLDKRRPQVMIEALVVEVSADQTFDVGVELARLGQSGDNVIGAGTSFGLSAINFNVPSIDIGSLAGLTGFLIHDANVAAIIHLFQQNVNGRVLSRPRTLVNDNESAVFRSEREEPYVQISNLGADTTTVSFTDYAKAGITLSVTPHISEADYLQLEIEVNLSAFQGTGTGNAPPPRTTNFVQSKVTVPDNCTVLLGGLNSGSERKTVQKVPGLGDIPLLGLLFRREIKTNVESTLYIFIKSRIARDEDFSDLIGMGAEASREAIELENVRHPQGEKFPVGEDVYESPAFRPKTKP